MLDLFEPLGRLVGSFGTVAAIGVGVIAGLIAGLLPGVSGRLGLLIAFPLVIGLDPFVGAVFLIAMHSVVHTSGSIPAILFGVPTSGSEAATVVDGYPMMRKGLGGQAVGATIASSAFGGLIGAVALIAFVPVGVLILPYVSSAEVAALGLVGLLSISALAGRGLARGLVVAALGVLASTVGLDGLTGTDRFTFGRLELWDGINIAAVIAGLFVIPEMLLSLDGSGKANPSSNSSVNLTRVLKGCVEALRYRWLTVRAALIGIIVGFIPGIGAGVAVWLAYGHASQSAKSGTPFGEGAVAGVIAAESANNSKEGGALAPTLLFAVPGTSSMGILLGAFAVLGIQAGPRLMATDPGFVSAIGWVVLLANLLAVPICLFLSPSMTRFAAVNRDSVVPVALVASVTASLVISSSIETIVQIALFGVLGLALQRADWPRAPFVLGFVIGPVLESALSRTVQIFGFSAFERPGVLVVLVATVGFGLVARRWRGAARAGRVKTAPPARALFTACAVFFAVVAIPSAGFPFQASLLPLLACGVGLASIVVPMVKERQAVQRGWKPPVLNPALGAWFLLYLAAIPVVGGPMASGLFAALVMRWAVGLSWRTSIVVALLLAGFTFGIAGDRMGLISPFQWDWSALA
ncbi:MAG: tripartite tricarboxylate transporter permease [Pseudomonadota bacterium]